MELCLSKLLNPLLNPNSKHRTLGCCALSPVLVLVTIGAASGGLADDKAAAWMSYTRGEYCPSEICLDRMIIIYVLLIFISCSRQKNLYCIDFMYCTMYFLSWLWWKYPPLVPTVSKWHSQGWVRSYLDISILASRLTRARPRRAVRIGGNNLHRSVDSSALCRLLASTEEDI